jgi:hypothetical protein
MEITMGITGERFVQFLRLKLRERKGRYDNYRDKDFARELGVEYDTLLRWLRSTSIERIDMDNLFAVKRLFGDEFLDYLEFGEYTGGAVADSEQDEPGPADAQRAGNTHRR